MSNQESKLTDAVNTSRMILDRLATDRGVASVPALGSRRATVENCVAHFRWYFRRPVPPREATVKQEQYAKLRDALYGADGSNECLTEPVRMEQSLFSTSDASESASRVMFPRPCHRKSFRVRDVTMLRDDEAPPALQAPLGCLADGFNLGGDVSIDQETHLLVLAGSALHARSVLIRAALYSCYGVPGLVEQLYPSTAPDVSRRRLASRHVERRGHLRQRHRLAEQLRLKALVNRDRDTACLLVRAATIMDGHPVEGLDQMESGVQPGSSSLESTGGLFNSTRTLLSDAARRCGRFVSEENARRDQSATMPTPLLVSIEHVSSALTVQPEQV